MSQQKSSQKTNSGDAAATRPEATVELTNEQLDTVTGGSFDIEQTLKIGSQSTGAGAGKVTFNPF